MAEKYSLKDELFNEKKVTLLAHEIKAVYRDFDIEQFIADAVSMFPQLELLARAEWITQMLTTHLPGSYDEALKIILSALPSKLDPALSDDDFGDFIYAPYGYFVSAHGLTSDNVELSLDAFEELTMRFSVELPIRACINAFPEETFARMKLWAQSENYHVRRLASESLRPKLPWAQKINIPYDQTIQILDELHTDPTRYVTRSVANHLNDIAKIDPELVVATLKRWKDQQNQEQKELDWMIRHSLRTLVKDGGMSALQLLGHADGPKIIVGDFLINTPKVTIGDTLEFSFKIEAEQDEKLLVDYVIGFVGKDGKHRKKVFKICSLSLKSGEKKDIAKKHPLKVMTTKALCAGKHTLELQINGRVVADGSFDLIKS